MDKEFIDNNISYAIYKNINKLFISANLELVSTDVTGIIKKKINKTEMLDGEIFGQTFQYYGYIIIEAADNKNKNRKYPQHMAQYTKSLPVKTIFILTDKNSEYVKSSQDMMKLLNNIPGINDMGKKYNLDVIIISYGPLTSHIINKISTYDNKGSDSGGYVRIISHEYSMFISEKLKHKSSPAYRILSPSEEEEILNEVYAEKTNFPKIRIIDPAAVWLGAEVGNIIEAKILSENTGEDIKYLVVRP